MEDAPPLFLNLPESEYKKGHKKAPSDGASVASMEAQFGDSVLDEGSEVGFYPSNRNNEDLVDEEMLKTLTEMGFPELRASKALALNSNDIESATQWYIYPLHFI
jgi:hypothetical protein